MPRKIRKPKPEILSVIDESFSYDPTTGSIVWKNRLNLTHSRAKVGEEAGSTVPSGYRHIRVSVEGVVHEFLASHVAWYLHHREWPTLEVDHKNTNRADDRIDNLRLATSVENNHNRSRAKNNTTGVKGVYPQQWGYAVRIMVKGKRIFGGTYKTIEEAAAVRRALELEHFGEFAVDEARAVSAVTSAE